jgi:hypothetical protein
VIQTSREKVQDDARWKNVTKSSVGSFAAVAASFQLAATKGASRADRPRP